MLYCVGESGDEFNTAMDMANFQEKKFTVVD